MAKTTPRKPLPPDHPEVLALNELYSILYTFLERRAGTHAATIAGDFADRVVFSATTSFLKPRPIPSLR